MLWTVDAVVAATGGSVTGAPAPAPTLTSVAIDSRTVAPGGLFVALRAERDGHEWIPAALARGAAAYLCDRAWPAAGDAGGVGIRVDDTAAALLDLGRAARHRLDGPVVGITGSVGKTSTKDLAAAALARRWRVAANEKSFNNELGVPLTLANAGSDAEVAVIEMGARGVGHIALLCEVARPTVAVVTAVAAAHTELFGGIDAVARAKGELVEALPPDGVAVLNADDERVAAMAGRGPAAVLRYSAAGAAGADVTAADVRVGPDLRPAFVLATPWGSGPVTLAARGAAQVGNALAAAGVALQLGVAFDAVVAALETAQLSPWRMELGTAPSGARILNDAYNANPASMLAALRALAALPAERRVAVLGAMAELGPAAGEEHRRVAAVARDLGVDVLAVATGEYGGNVVDDLDAAVAALGPLGPGDAVLVKASRVAGLERLAARLLAGAPPPGRDEPAGR